MKLAMKLNTLIAVMKVALAKLERNMTLPGTNIERVEKIIENLTNTLGICQRAKKTLDTGATKDSEIAEDVIDELLRHEEPGFQMFSEERTGSWPPSWLPPLGLHDILFPPGNEYNKFKGLPPITADDIKSTDLDKLSEQLGNHD